MTLTCWEGRPPRIKHRHIAEEALRLDRPEATLLGVLLLRGAQTPGELKQRTERMHAFATLEGVNETLGRLIGPREKIRDELEQWRESPVTTMIVSGPPSQLGAIADIVLG